MLNSRTVPASDEASYPVQRAAILSQDPGSRKAQWVPRAAPDPVGRFQRLRQIC